MTPDAPVLGLAGLFGLALGSYAVTAAVRLSRAEPSVVGRSHCDHCGQTLGFGQTIPVVSYIYARGTCRACRERIDPIHLMGELAGLLVLVTAFLAGDPVRGAFQSLLGLLLICASATDWKVGRLPNRLNAAIAATALALSALTSVRAVETGLVAAALSLAMLQALRAVMRKLRGDPGMGLGDVKLVGALALWLGLATPWMVVACLPIGLIMTVITRPAGGRLATGPALAAAGWIVGIVWEWGHWPTTA